MGHGGWFKKLTQVQVDEACELYKHGWSLAKIGEKFGVTRQAMHELLCKRIQLRNNLRFKEENHFFRDGSIADGGVHNKTEKALKRGKLVNPKICQACGIINPIAKDGRTKVIAHHDDYNKPLDVRWLCSKCHHEWHRHNKAIKKLDF